jgi:chitin disaccharide deacetylase
MNAMQCLRWIAVCAAASTALKLSAGESPGASGAARTRYLIIHADDAGMSHSVNRGTIQAMEQGIVSSASIMVPCPWFPEIAEYARTYPDKDFGLHLTLTSEWQTYRWGPVAPREKVPSLVDERGFLWPTIELVARHAKVEEVEIELRAQIERARQFGVPVTHLDTHMGALGGRADLLDLYAKLAIEYKLPILYPRDAADKARAGDYPGIIARHEKMIQTLEDHGLPVVDYLPPIHAGIEYEQRRDAYLSVLRALKPGVTQIIVHCGVDDAELRAITPRYMNREGDRRVFMDPVVIEEVKRLGIELIGWKDLSRMTAKVDK